LSAWLCSIWQLVVPILGGWIAQNRPRFGSERLASEVDAYREMGYHRSELTVRPKPGVPAPTDPAADPEGV
jgi:hypothetical protein